jgi:hypothetical protein
MQKPSAEQLRYAKFKMLERFQRNVMKSGEGSAIVNAGTACVPKTLRKSSRIIRSTV